MNLAIVTAEFNHKLTHRMEDVATEEAVSRDANIIKIVRVPGAFEIPFAVKKLIKNKNIDGIITLGAVIKGATAHDEVVANNAAEQIMKLSLEFEKPVSLGIIGPKVTRQQAIDRHEEYAKRAVSAVISMLKNNYSEK